MSDYSVQEVMRCPVYTIQPADSVAQAVRAMKAHGVSSLIVLPRFEGEAYGIITQHDIIAKVIAEGQNTMRVPVKEAMSRPVYAVAPDCSLRECASLMLLHRIRRLPVFADGRPVGVLSRTTVFGALFNSSGELAA